MPRATGLRRAGPVVAIDNKIAWGALAPPAKVVAWAVAIFVCAVLFAGGAYLVRSALGL